jgi:hypothetical protein
MRTVAWASSRALVSLVSLLSLVACTCDEAPEEAAPASPVASSSAPPPLPSAAPPAPFERLAWETPPTWRNLGVSMQGVTKAHYQAYIDDPHQKVPEVVEVFVVHHEAARGDTPEAKVADAMKHESDAFAKVDSKKSESRIVNGRKIEILELHGSMNEYLPVPPDYEKALQVRPHRTEITAFVPTLTFPYRVALHGRDDLVERVRDDFFHFVDTLRIEDEQKPPPPEPSASAAPPSSASGAPSSRPVPPASAASR